MGGCGSGRSAKRMSSNAADAEAPRRRDVEDEQRRTPLEPGLPQREIARRLGIPRSTLQEHLKRLQVVPVHRGPPTVGAGIDIPGRPPHCDRRPH
jgi:DNA-binding NtrC family response regulator